MYEIKEPDAALELAKRVVRLPPSKIAVLEREVEALENDDGAVAEVKKSIANQGEVFAKMAATMESLAKRVSHLETR